MKKILEIIKDNTAKHFFLINFLNSGILLFTIFYIGSRFIYVNEQIPLLYTKPWGEKQLADKQLLLLMPLLILVIWILSNIFSIYAKRQLIRFGAEILLNIGLFTNFAVAISIFRIINISSTTFPPFLPQAYTNLVGVFMLTALITYLIAPKFIEFFKKNGIVTDPLVHKHPGMLLTRPSARGGGVIFTSVLIVVASIFLQVNTRIIGILIAVLIAAITGILDDIVNTNPYTKFKIFGNPFFRLVVMQTISALCILAVGIQINFINNPLNGLLNFDLFQISFGQFTFYPLAIIVTIFWVLWVLNMLSFSNGVDGQYSGIVGIAMIMIGLISIRNPDFSSLDQDIAMLAFIGAGAAIGLLPFTWYPSKVMWGFSATSAGMLIAALAIVSGSKIATAIIILLIPFLDAVITITRRILQKKNPLKGDRGHLHHLLIERGWGVRRISVFYWISTAFFGLIAYLSSDKDIPLISLMLSGLVAFVIIVLNLRSLIRKQAKQKSDL